MHPSNNSPYHLVSRSIKKRMAEERLSTYSNSPCRSWCLFSGLAYECCRLWPCIMPCLFQWLRRTTVDLEQDKLCCASIRMAREKRFQLLFQGAHPAQADTPSVVSGRRGTLADWKPRQDGHFQHTRIINAVVERPSLITKSSCAKLFGKTGMEKGSEITSCLHKTIHLCWGDSKPERHKNE